jgi:anti-sigma regulatory factor (Ser/Thr protein kinase)
VLVNALVVLPRDLRAPRDVRTWITERLDPLDLPEPQVEEVLLVASELVTNVLVHTPSEPVVRLVADQETLRIEVIDASTEVAAIRAPERGRPGGWGLRMVDSIADAWGTDRREDGTKVVWFTLAIR